MLSLSKHSAQASSLAGVDKFLCKTSVTIRLGNCYSTPKIVPLWQNLRGH